jgi:hypothetical protein
VGRPKNKISIHSRWRIFSIRQFLCRNVTRRVRVARRRRGPYRPCRGLHWGLRWDLHWRRSLAEARSDRRDKQSQKANAEPTWAGSHAVILPHFEILGRENSRCRCGRARCNPPSYNIGCVGRLVKKGVPDETQ